MNEMACFCLGSSEDEITLEGGRGKDSRLIFQVGDSEGQTWKVSWEYFSVNPHLRA
jgi:hypothetical protein